MLIISRVGALVPYVNVTCNVAIDFSADHYEAGNILQAQLQHCINFLSCSCLRVLRCSILESFDPPQTWSKRDCLLGPWKGQAELSSLCRWGHRANERRQGSTARYYGTPSWHFHYLAPVAESTETGSVILVTRIVWWKRSQLRPQQQNTT